MFRRALPALGLAVAALSLTSCGVASASGEVTANDDAAWGLAESVQSVLVTASAEEQATLCANYLALANGSGTPEGNQALATFITSLAEAVAEDQGFTTAFTEEDLGTAGMLGLSWLCES